MRTSFSKCSKGTFDVGTTFGSGVGEFKDGYTSGNLRKMVDKGMLDMDDLVEVWKSPLIPNGPIVVRTSLDADMKDEVQAVHDRPAEDRHGLLLGHPGRRLHRLHRGDAGILPADHRRPQSADRRRKPSGSRNASAASSAAPFLPCRATCRMSTSPDFAHQRRRTGRAVERHWRELANRRRLYTARRAAVHDPGDVAARCGSPMRATPASSSTACRIFFDFIDQLVPRDGWEVWRAMFDLPSPYDDGSLKYNYPEGRMYLTETLYVPEYFYKMLETINIALVSTLIGFAFGFVLCFLAASNMVDAALAALLRAPLHGNPARLSRDRDRRLLPRHPVARRRCRRSSRSRSTPSARSARCSSKWSRMPTCGPTKACARPAPTGSSGSGSRIVPQVMPNFLSYALLRLEINVRASTIIGAVGGGGIGEVLRLSISQTHEAKTWPSSSCCC